MGQGVFIERKALDQRLAARRTGGPIPPPGEYRGFLLLPKRTGYIRLVE